MNVYSIAILVVCRTFKITLNNITWYICSLEPGTPPPRTIIIVRGGGVPGSRLHGMSVEMNDVCQK